MRRKNRVLAYITAKKYYLSLIGCLIITLVAVGIIYNKDQKYEEIANLNEVPQEQSLVDNPKELDVLTTDEAFEVVNPVPEITVHQENVPEVAIIDEADIPATTIVEETPETTVDEILNVEDKDALEVFEPIIEVQQPNLTFASAQGMMKPITGDILIPYSNTIPVYFKTLDQYKISLGEYISSDVGNEVKVAADGVIEKIEQQAVKGYMITVYHGNGFKSMYGQLKEDMNVKEGDMVYEGDILGYIEKPTSYYSLEGPHLYFEVLENGKPIDPEPLFQ